jgi:hypothetical protein
VTPDLAGPAAVALLAGLWATWRAGRWVRGYLLHVAATRRAERDRWAAYDQARSVVDQWRAEAAAERAVRDARSDRLAVQARAIRPVGTPVDLNRSTR